VAKKKGGKILLLGKKGAEIYQCTLMQYCTYSTEDKKNFVIRFLPMRTGGEIGEIFLLPKISVCMGVLLNDLHTHVPSNP
jgi:hypothetical protein